MEYIFKKGELNKLFDLNQDLKNIFSNYLIFNNSLIIGTNKLHKGKHFVISEYRVPFDHVEGTIYNIDSRMVFDSVSKNKKNITSIIIDDNKIYIKGEDLLFQIGDCIFKESHKIKEEINSHIHFVEMISQDKYDVAIGLSEENVNDLIKNEYININEKKYRTRITKEIIPGLKKQHKVSIILYKHDVDKQLFHLAIKVIRDKNISYHIYTCLFM